MSMVSVQVYKAFIPFPTNILRVAEAITSLLIQLISTAKSLHKYSSSLFVAKLKRDFQKAKVSCLDATKLEFGQVQRKQGGYKQGEQRKINVQLILGCCVFGMLKHQVCTYWRRNANFQAAKNILRRAFFPPSSFNPCEILPWICQFALGLLHV